MDFIALRKIILDLRLAKYFEKGGGGRRVTLKSLKQEQYSAYTDLSEQH